MREQVEEIIKKNNFDDLLNYIHTLKGLSGTIGATVLAEEAYAMEQKLKQNRALNIIDFESIFIKQKELFELLKVNV